jgi:hypothetical protein
MKFVLNCFVKILSYLGICIIINTALSIYAIGTQSTPTRPATPSIIVTVDKISSLTTI